MAIHNLIYSGSCDSIRVWGANVLDTFLYCNVFACQFVLKKKQLVTHYSLTNNPLIHFPDRVDD